MANTTFNGPVRALNGFEQITKTAGTGAITTNFDVDASGNVSGTGTLKLTGAANILSDYASITDATLTITSADSNDIIDLGAVEQGWLTGGIIRLFGVNTTTWFVDATLMGDGTLATPFVDS